MLKLPRKLRALFGLPEKTRGAEKRAERRDESAVKSVVRQACVDRDGYCRMSEWDPYGCAGPSEWAHFGEGRRSKTRGMEPEERHTTVWSLMLCRRHHALEERHTIRIEPLNAGLGANWLLRFVRTDVTPNRSVVETEMP